MTTSLNALNATALLIKLDTPEGEQARQNFVSMFVQVSKAIELIICPSDSDVLKRELKTLNLRLEEAAAENQQIREERSELLHEFRTYHATPRGKAFARAKELEAELQRVQQTQKELQQKTKRVPVEPKQKKVARTLNLTAHKASILSVLDLNPEPLKTRQIRKLLPDPNAAERRHPADARLADLVDDGLITRNGAVVMINEQGREALQRYRVRTGNNNPIIVL